MKEKDKRVRTVNEVLSGIKVLKLYSWENSFESKVSDVAHVISPLCKYLSFSRLKVFAMKSSKL